MPDELYGTISWLFPPVVSTEIPNLFEKMSFTAFFKIEIIIVALGGAKTLS